MIKFFIALQKSILSANFLKPCEQAVLGAFLFFLKNFKKTIDLELTPSCIIYLTRTKTSKGGDLMTIKEVCEKFTISPDTLRYYERVGVIPEVSRTKGGIRDYTEEDLAWVENAVCMRSAGVPVEMLIEYVKLFREGDETLKARCDLLIEARVEVQKNLDKYLTTMERLNFKISRYEEALKTGILTWDVEDK